MKKLLIPILLFIMSTPIFAQVEIQLHYDFGDTRKCLTSTLQMFDQDRLGNSFFFIDMNHGQDDVDGINLAYLEIYRTFNFSKNSTFAAHIEYNGGLGNYETPSGIDGYTINDAWLAGVEYTWGWNDYKNFLTLQGMYKTIRDKNDASFQLTAIWYFEILEGKIAFEGFMDYWKEDNYYADGDKTEYTWLAEPQIWFTVKGNFSIGSEIEMSTNLSGNKGFMVNPTIAGRYVF